MLKQSGTFILLRLDDIREPDPKPFESVKAEVKMSLMEEMGRERMENRLVRRRIS